MRNITYIFIFTIISFIGCSGTVIRKDTESQKPVSIIRFDKDVFNYLLNPDPSKEKSLRSDYPMLLPAFAQIAMDDSDPNTFFTSMQEYFSNSMLRKIYKDALSTFSDVTPYEKELTSANSLISKYFEGKSLPELAMHVSGFRENVIILNNLISISVDKYLGRNYNAYLDFFQPFERQQMQPRYLVRDYIKAWLMSDIFKTSTGANDQSLLTSMIYEGKILYILSMLLPDEKVDDIIGYTSEQSEWCSKNEKNMWNIIIKQNYLFSIDHMIITRFINDAPYTTTISKDSPGGIGRWVGWQIVNKYAKKKNISLSDLIKTDPQAILKEAKYNP